MCLYTVPLIVCWMVTDCMIMLNIFSRAREAEGTYLGSPFVQEKLCIYNTLDCDIMK